MAKLHSMKIEKGDRDAVGPAQPSPGGQPAYPWGLSLNLDNDALEKLGLGFDDFKVDAKMTIVARVEVTSISSNETRGSDPSNSVGLQITDLCVEDGATKAADAADALYKQ